MNCKTMFIGVLGTLSGCSSVCTGPGCEDDYTIGRLEVLNGAVDLPRSANVLGGSSKQWIGDDTQGSDWSIAVTPGAIWIGQPALSQVIRIASDGQGKLPSTPQIWSGSGSFGTAIATVDLDGDGVQDLIVGDPEYDLGAGGVFVFLGAETSSGSANTQSADRILKGAASADALGTRITVCGDMSGDALPEIAFGAPSFGATSGLIDVPALAGVVFVADSAMWSSAGRGERAGQAPGVSPLDVGRAYWGEQTGDGAGSAVVCDRDISGDRVPDLVVGSPWFNNANGRVYAVLPETTDTRSLPETSALIDAAAFTLDPPQEGEWFGTSLLMLNLDNQEPSDLAVGAPGYNTGAGRVHIYAGSELEDGVAKSLVVIRHSADTPDHFGRTLLQADLDGDGREDLIVGAPDWQEGGNGFDAGRIWMWSGAIYRTWGTKPTIESAHWKALGSEPFQRVGRSPVAADLDGDGIDDLLLPTAARAK